MAALFSPTRTQRAVVHDHDGAMIATVVDDAVWEMDYYGDVK